jgi:hypothetical protein
VSKPNFSDQTPIREWPQFPLRDRKTKYFPSAVHAPQHS